METMSSPGLNPGTPKGAELFEDVWKRLRELHQDALQDLEAKVSKLKKERCLDAQKLELFYKRSQQLKEQNKALQDTISLLEARLRSGDCDACAILKEALETNQDQNQRLVTKLTNEKKILEDENRKLQAELQKVKMSGSELRRVSSPEQEEDIIPCTPVMHSSLPVANKLRRHTRVHKTAHVRYAETHLRKSNKTLFSGQRASSLVLPAEVPDLDSEPVDATKNVRTAEVLVPNTCEQESSQPSDGGKSVDHLYLETSSEERGDSELVDSGFLFALRPQCSLAPPLTTVHSPDSTTDRSPSLLRVQSSSQEAFKNKAKRKKEGECEPTTREDNKRGKREDEIRGGSSSFSRPIFREPPEKKSVQTRTTKRSVEVSGARPTFNNADVSDDGRRVKFDLLSEEKTAEATWSLDPALAVSMDDSEKTTDQQAEEQQREEELADTDCTWISHSLLQRRGQAAATGLGQRANDSLDMLFDTTAYGEYQSYSGSQPGQSQPDPPSVTPAFGSHVVEDPREASVSQRNENKAGFRRPTFAHMAVIRKKDERKKLKGATCKECEVYYAHLPEEEKKKLSACSRHRFLYVPPSTPEYFWEVGFPSTQTCIRRGYIREEKSPQARTREKAAVQRFLLPKASPGGRPD
uniref:DNA endonuclease RBBP8 n=1 Tax=Tetraodon nigroviridis TaxID=99883 RepID=H3CTM4_TETNG